MLRELHIKNLSIIEDITVEFGGGFNVLTGETGAGKSIIIDALSLALGERAAGEFIRTGEKEAVVEAYFDIPQKMHPSLRDILKQGGIDAENGLILKRIISAQGKNRAYINGSMASVQALSDISRTMIDVHGQYEHQSLLSPEKQLDLLDAFGGLLSTRKKITSLYEAQLTSRRRINELTQREKDRAQRIDVLTYQINEIETAGLTAGEDEHLREEAKLLSNAVRLAELSNQSYESLYSSDSSCITVLSNILDNLREISTIDARAREALKSVEDALPLLEEAGYFLRDYKNSLDFDPDRLEQVQERLELIKSLRKKYGENIQEVLDYREKAVFELEELQHSGEKLDSFKGELQELKKEMTGLAHDLSEKRKATAKKIENQVIAQLSELSMPGTEFSIRIVQEEGDDTTDGFKSTHTGIDIVEFLISPNVGESLKPLSKVASGGELSRVMLALKSILAKGDSIPVLVFDEIDAGIGGKTAETVAGKLKKLSSQHQVVCITHLPQIASRADGHLKIEKSSIKGRTIVAIDTLDNEDRTSEIARMLSGELSDVSVRHAREMLKRSRL
jgi:DNA repair protein RecN (Recombination protein N)